MLHLPSGCKRLKIYNTWQRSFNKTGNKKLGVGALFQLLTFSFIIK
ncbi:Uncharacterised protein [Segatella copri]|nr:Uncharacterised protein [Segatella copri]